MAWNRLLLNGFRNGICGYQAGPQEPFIATQCGDLADSLDMGSRPVSGRLVVERKSVGILHFVSPGVVPGRTIPCSEEYHAPSFPADEAWPPAPFTFPGNIRSDPQLSFDPPVATKQMRIFYFACGVDLGKPVNGAAVHVIEMVKALGALGNDVVLVGLFSRKPTYFSGALVGGFMKERGAMKRTRNLLIWIWFILRRVDVIRGSSVYVRWGSGATVVCTMCSILKISFAVEMNGIYSLVDKPGWRRRFKSKIASILESRYLRMASTVFTTTEKMAEYYREIYDLGRDVVVANPCGANELPSSFSLTQGHGLVPFSLDDPVVGYAGGLWHDNGIDTLIKSAPVVLNSNKNVRFLIIGTSDEEDLYREMVDNKGLSESFEFMGAVPYYEVGRYLSCVDVAVAPYNQTEELDRKGGGTPQKIFTYLSCEKITIISDLEYYSHFRKCSACKFFETGNYTDLADVILSVLEMDSIIRHELGEMGRDFVLREFSWEKSARTVINVLTNASANLAN